MVVQYHGAGDDVVTQNRRGRGNAVFRRLVFRHTLTGIDFTGVAEIGTGFTGIRIQGNEACIHGAGEDAVLTKPLATRAPAADAATVGQDRVIVHVHFRVEGPELLPGFCVQRDNTIKGRAVIQPVVDQDRGDLHGALRKAAGAYCARVTKVAGTVMPGNLEVGDITRGNLVGAREMRASWCGAVGRPAGGDSGRRFIDGLGLAGSKSGHDNA